MIESDVNLCSRSLLFVSARVELGLVVQNLPSASLYSGPRRARSFTSWRCLPQLARGGLVRGMARTDRAMTSMACMAELRLAQPFVFPLQLVAHCV